jgi:hypothetical protein
MEQSISIIDKFLDFLSSNGDIILGFTIASLGTLLGWLLNWFTHRKQLEHDATEREKERDHQLLKEVYLKANVAVSKIIFWIETMSPSIVSPTHGEGQKSIIDLKDVDFSYDQIDLVGSENVVKAFTKFMEHYHEVRTNLQLKLLPFLKIYDQVEKIKSDIDWRTKFSEQIHKERMELFNNPDGYDEGMGNILTKRYNEMVEIIDQKNEELPELNTKISLMTLEFEKEKREKMVGVYSASYDLVFEIRKDLKKYIKEDEIREIYKNHHSKMIELFTEEAEQSKRFLDEIRNQD